MPQTNNPPASNPNKERSNAKEGKGDLRGNQGSGHGNRDLGRKVPEEDYAGNKEVGEGTDAEEPDSTMEDRDMPESRQGRNQPPGRTQPSQQRDLKHPGLEMEEEAEEEGEEASSETEKSRETMGKDRTPGKFTSKRETSHRT